MKRFFVPAAVALTIAGSAVGAQAQGRMAGARSGFNVGFTSSGNRVIATDGTPVLDMGMQGFSGGGGAGFGGAGFGNNGFGASGFGAGYRTNAVNGGGMGMNQFNRNAFGARAIDPRLAAFYQPVMGGNGSFGASATGQNGGNGPSFGFVRSPFSQSPTGFDRGAYLAVLQARMMAQTPMLNQGVGTGIPLMAGYAGSPVFRVGQVPTLGITAPSMMNGGGRTFMPVGFGPRFYR